MQRVIDFGRNEGYISMLFFIPLEAEYLAAYVAGINVFFQQ